jgi:hypothetical protein
MTETGTTGIDHQLYFVAVLVCREHQFSCSSNAYGIVQMLCPVCAQNERRLSYARQRQHAKDVQNARLHEKQNTASHAEPDGDA